MSDADVLNALKGWALVGAPSWEPRPAGGESLERAFAAHGDALHGYVLALSGHDSRLAEELVTSVFAGARDEADQERAALFMQARDRVLALLAKTGEAHATVAPAELALLLERRAGLGLDALARTWGTRPEALKQRLIESVEHHTADTPACSEWKESTVRASVDLLDEEQARRWGQHLMRCESCASWSEALELRLALGEGLPSRERAWECVRAQLSEHTHDLGVRVGVRCTYCHAGLPQAEASFCAACLAPHHADCFAGHGHCAAPACAGTQLVYPRTPPRRRAWPLLVGAGLLVAAAALAPAAYRSAVGERSELVSVHVADGTTRSSDGVIVPQPFSYSEVEEKQETPLPPRPSTSTGSAASGRKVVAEALRVARSGGALEGVLGTTYFAAADSSELGRLEVSLSPSGEGVDLVLDSWRQDARGEHWEWRRLEEGVAWDGALVGSVFWRVNGPEQVDLNLVSVQRRRTHYSVRSFGIDFRPLALGEELEVPQVHKATRVRLSDPKLERRNCTSCLFSAFVLPLLQSGTVETVTVSSPLADRARIHLLGFPAQGSRARLAEHLVAASTDSGWQTESIVRPDPVTPALLLRSLDVRAISEAAWRGRMQSLPVPTSLAFYAPLSSRPTPWDTVEGVTSALEELFERALGEYDRPAQQLELLDRLLVISPDYPPAVYVRAQCLFQLGRYEEARQAARRYLDHAPDDEQGWVQLGACCIRLSDHVAAAQAYSRAIELAPGDSRVYLGRAMVRMAQGDYAAATQDFEQSLRIGPAQHAARFNLGLAYQRMGRQEKAREVMQDLILREPGERLRARAESWLAGEGGEALERDE